MSATIDPTLRRRVGTTALTVSQLGIGGGSSFVRSRAIDSICGRHDVPLAAAALQFPLHHPAVTSVAVGHERASEGSRNVALIEQPVPAALWSELKEGGLIPRESADALNARADWPTAGS